ncbi:MAG TPA: MFS transporter [Pseudolabrys sp.]|jgi:MHS family proline/betaine transporter-like MFS transporter|nr:MFS transporter [Pseudolabrys sp.]
MSVSAVTAAVPRQASTFKILAAASIGNALEFYDILIYGYFAVTISKLFFPTADPTTALLLTFGTFGISYLVRPLGALVLGAYADRAGRRAAMLVSIVIMSAGTGLMAIMPTYASIGILAPIAVLIARLLQGFAVAGEFGSATAFLVEHSKERKGFFASFQWFGQGIAAVLSSFFGVILYGWLTTEQLEGWGWRVPFFFGLLIGPIGLYIRKHLGETPEFRDQGPAHAPLRQMFAKHWDRLLMCIGIVVLSTSSNYIILYMPTYAIKQLHLPQSLAFIATLIGGLLLTFGAPLFGHLSDRIGRVRMMVIVSTLFAVSAYPSFMLLVANPSLAGIVTLVCWLSLLKAAYSGTLPALMAELFPTATRSTGIAVAYNTSVPIFGGTAPLIATWLVAATGSALAPSFYLIATSVLSLVVLVIIHLRVKTT